MQRPSVRRWLSAARHPARRDGVIAAALLALPWALAWAVAPHHHLDATAVTILAAVTIPLSGLWLTWAAFRNASRAAPADSGARPGIIAAGPGAVVADRGGTAIGQVVYQQRRGVTGKPVRLADPPPLLAGREDLLAELDTRLTGGESPGPRTVALCGLGGAGKTSVALAYARRHLAEVGVAWRFAAEDPTVLAAGFAELAAQLGARDLAEPGTRWRRCTDARRVPRGVAADLRQRAGPGSGGAFLAASGAGRVLITSRNRWPPGQVLMCRCSTAEVAAGFLVSRTGDRTSRLPRAGHRAGWVAAGAGAGRRLHPGQRRHARRVPDVVPAAAAGDAGPR